MTGDLDEGPIIEQNVQRVDHAETVADMTAMGHELESRIWRPPSVCTPSTAS